MIGYFYPERPRLMSIDQPLFDRLDSDQAWVAEPKINGARLQLRLIDEAWEFWGRHGERLAYQPSRELVDALDTLELAGHWLFDGELRHNKVKGIQHKICLYDVFMKGGELLLGWRFEDRRKLLEEYMLPSYPDSDYAITIPCQYASGFRQAFGQLTRSDEVEGLVIKNLNGRLALGRTSAIDSAWMWKVRKPNNSYKM